MSVGGGGGEYISSSDAEPLLIGTNFAFGTYSAAETVLSFDTTSLLATPSLATLDLAITFSGPNIPVTAIVAVYDWGASIDSADWRTTAQLAGLTEAGRFDPDVSTSVNLDPSTLVVGGITRFIVYIEDMETGTDPTDDQDFFVDGDGGSSPPVLSWGTGSTTAQAIDVTQMQTPILTPTLSLLLPYQFILDGDVFGAGTTVHVDAKGIEGLGVPDAKTQDVVWAYRDGAYGNPDYTALRLITIPAIIRAATETAALTELKTLETAWAPRAADTTLTMTFPSWGSVTATGRPRGLKADLTRARRGVIHVLLRFDCLDPELVFA